ncbi:hypothetical protein AgCh_033659 [Apium graveolens]
MRGDKENVAEVLRELEKEFKCLKVRSTAPPNNAIRARLLPCLKAAEPGVDSTGGIPIGPIVGAIGAGGELIELGLMPGVIIPGGLAIGDGIAIGGGVIIIGGGVIIIGGGVIIIGGGVIIIGGGVIIIGGGVIIIGGGVIIIGGDIIIGGMVEGDIAGAWPEDKTANVSDKVNMSMECEKAMTLCLSKSEDKIKE